jgi:hypothetical protein
MRRFCDVDSFAPPVELDITIVLTIVLALPIRTGPVDPRVASPDYY